MTDQVPSGSISQRHRNNSRLPMDGVPEAAVSLKPQAFGSHYKGDIGKRPSTKPESVAAAAAREWSVDLHEGAPLITAKSLIGGVLVGILCSFLAMYYSLKTGVVPSLNILSGLGGFVLVRALIKIKVFHGIFTPQENAVVQTVSVAVYSMSSVGMGFGSAYLAMNHNAWEDMGGADFPGNFESDTLDLTWLRSFLWCISLGFFGFFLAFPVRDYIILRKRLPFPSGTVTAYVIKNMHAVGTNTLTSFSLLAKFFSIAFMVNMITWVFEDLDSVPIFGIEAASRYGWALDFDIGSFGIGAILPVQIGGSMMLGAVLLGGLIQPLIFAYKNGPGPDDWVDLENIKTPFLGLQCYGVFAGLAVMLVAGCWSIISLLILLYKDYRNPASPDMDELQDAETGAVAQRTFTDVLHDRFRVNTVPVWLPYTGYILFGGVAMILLDNQFKVKWYQTLVTLCVIPIFAISNIQGVGKTDWDVSSSYGKIIMFPFGAWNTGKSILPSLAMCSTTISGCSNAASLLQDFKTGLLVGASPNAMFISQFFGAAVGALVSPTLFLLLTSAFRLPNSRDPTAFLQGRYGTIYRILAVVATGSGFSALPKNVLWISFAFLLLALILMALDTWGPKALSPYLPDASALSIGLLVPLGVSLEFFLGGFIVWWWTRWNPEGAKKVPYIASGAVAGSGIGVVCRCLLSLLDISPPIQVEWKKVDQSLSAGRIVGAVFFGIIFVTVMTCGLWFWNQTEERDIDTDGAQLIVDLDDEGRDIDHHGDFVETRK